MTRLRSAPACSVPDTPLCAAIFKLRGALWTAAAKLPLSARPDTLNFPSTPGKAGSCYSRSPSKRQLRGRSPKRSAQLDRRRRRREFIPRSGKAFHAKSLSLQTKRGRFTLRTLRLGGFARNCLIFSRVLRHYQ